MQQCVSMLRQSSKDVPFGEEDKELNPAGVGDASASNPAEGEVAAPTTAEGEVAAPTTAEGEVATPTEAPTEVGEAPVEEKLTPVEGDPPAIVVGEVLPGDVEVQPEISGEAQEAVEEKSSD
uniref:Uncharacterized protein n=2 Tax=Cuerna arida TaxID=1464854 RepID=A0A1B6GH56_9HEMI